MLCSNGQSIDAQTYQALQTTIDMDGLMDLLELHEVHESWKHAELLNREWQAKLPTGR